jgi:RNA polymerase sigma factor (sigma-70 family)
LEELNELITDCKAGKREAQAKLYRLFSPILFGVCKRYARDTSEAEDFLHEGFMIIFSKIDQFAFKGSFEGWMKRIMVNLALERYRTRYRMHTVEDIVVYESRSINEDVYGEINAKQLLEYISELSPRYKMVFNLYAIDGFTHKEIAEQMGINEGTSKSNLNRARKILQDKVEQMGIKRGSYAR